MEIQKKEEALNININFFCNQKCIFCSEGDKKQYGFLNGRKDVDFFERIKNGNNRFEKIIFTTGEPTLNKKLFTYINYVRNYNYTTVSLITNGSTLGSKRIRDNIISSPLTEITVSIHGSNAKIHDFITGVDGCFDQTIKGLILLKKSDFKGKIFISYVLNSVNLHDLFSSIKLFSRLGIDLHLINVMRPEGYGKEKMGKLSIKYENFVNYIQSLGDIKIQYINTRIRDNKLNIMDIPICFLKEAGLDISSYGKVEIMNNSSQNSEYSYNNIDKKKKLEACKKCQYIFSCEGIYSDYLDINNIKLKAIN